MFHSACVSTDSKGLSNPGEVEALREKVYASLEAYCKQKYPEQPGRYEHKPRRNGATSPGSESDFTFLRFQQWTA